MADTASDNPFDKFVNPFNGPAGDPLANVSKGIQTDARAAGDMLDDYIPGAKKVGGALANGMALGDKLGEQVFGPMGQTGSHTEEVPADGVYKPSTGNQYVDKAVNGVGSAIDWAKGLF